MASVQKSTVVAPAPASSPLSLTDFLKFPRLPNHVREMIWKIVLPGPRIVFLEEREIGPPVESEKDEDESEDEEAADRKAAEEWELWGYHICPSAAIPSLSSCRRTRTKTGDRRS
jgi:hypothetical protein